MLRRRLSLHFTLFKHFTVGCLLRFKKVLSFSNEFSLFVTFTLLSLKWYKVTNFDAVSGWRLLHLFKDRVVHVLEKLSLSISFFSVLQLAKDGSFGHKMLLLNGNLLINI
jgi:hypothetical protein